MKKAIIKGTLIASGAIGSNVMTGVIAHDAGFESGLSKVEVVADDNIAAGGDAEAIVKILKAAGKQAEVEQYSTVGARGYWGNLWAAIWGAQ